MDSGHFCTQLILLLIVLWSSWFMFSFAFSQSVPLALKREQYARDKAAVGTVIEARYPWLDDVGVEDNIMLAMPCVYEKQKLAHENTINGRTIGLVTPEFKFIAYCVDRLSADGGGSSFS
jgi:hypothetical protein